MALHESLDTAKWPHWKEYIATHDMSEGIVGDGIIDVRVEEIEGTSDPNRGGTRRVDFVIYSKNGNQWRLHPGSKRQDDAQPIPLSDVGALPPDATVATLIFDATVGTLPPDATSTTCVAHMYQKPPRVYTSRYAERIPQHDRMGRNRMFEKLKSLPQSRPLELTTSTVDAFPWWLWLPTIGMHREEIIGNGIKRFALMQTWQHRNGQITAAQFLSVHQDDTAILLNAGHDVGYWTQTLEDPSEYEWYVNWETYDQ